MPEKWILLPAAFSVWSPPARRWPLEALQGVGRATALCSCLLCVSPLLLLPTFSLLPPFLSLPPSFLLSPPSLPLSPYCRPQIGTVVVILGLFNYSLTHVLIYLFIYYLVVELGPHLCILLLPDHSFIQRERETIILELPCTSHWCQDWNLDCTRKLFLQPFLKPLITVETKCVCACECMCICTGDGIEAQGICLMDTAPSFHAS